MDYKPGSLVHTRDRDWVVLPSNDKNLVLLKPLGGSDEEVTGIYLPLQFQEDKIESAQFPAPTEEDISDIASARLLYNACRLSFRNVAGPFRCLGKLSFRPRPYQVVPLIMALKQTNPIRLLIADDVGVGKTIEALLILKEFIERGEIKRFAVVALPHLCEQWQEELKDKFGIDAVIIRSNTQARLDREIRGDTSVYEYYPYQVISVDYIKSEQRRQVFIQECPEFIIVDESHACTHPLGTSIDQQRYKLIKDLSLKKNQHLVLLTATPHSGKPEQFNSLLGLLNPKFESIDIPASSQNERRELAKHFVQRRRADVEKWMGENTDFPIRDSGEYSYELSPQYHAFYQDIVDFALGLTKEVDGNEKRKRFRYWSALALLRGVMSSPASGVEMLKNRIEKTDSNEGSDNNESNPVSDEDFGPPKDFLPSGILSRTEWSDYEKRKLTQLSASLSALQGIRDDQKANSAIKILNEWLKQDFSTVVFCRFIATANYLGAVLTEELTKQHKKIDIQVVTSEDPDEVRRNRIENMATSKKKILIATDCLSEGINLQEHFNAVLHYDLPWNPNRLEQREGRIDRFGQQAKTVKAYLLYGKDNPIDGVVLRVLLDKVREIRRQTGISIPFPEDSQTIMDAVFQAVFNKAQEVNKEDPKQLKLTFDEIDEVKEKELEATNAIEKAAEREKISRSIFAQHAIKATEIEQDLIQADLAIGTPKAVESFVVEAVTDLLGVQISKDRDISGYTLFTANLPEVLKVTLPDKPELKISFYSPTPEDYLYIGRNHIFVEQLCFLLMSKSINHDTKHAPGRASVIKCKSVNVKTTLLLFRVRNVIEEKQAFRQVVAEEMLLWGYRGNLEDSNFLSDNDLQDLLLNVVPTANISREARQDFLDAEKVLLQKIKNQFDSIALKRAEILIEAHERFRKAIGGTQYQVVNPVLPMDLMGIYIFLPDK